MLDQLKALAGSGNWFEFATLLRTLGEVPDNSPMMGELAPAPAALGLARDATVATVLQAVGVLPEEWARWERAYYYRTTCEAFGDTVDAILELADKVEVDLGRVPTNSADYHKSADHHLRAQQEKLIQQLNRSRLQLQTRLNGVNALLVERDREIERLKESGTALVPQLEEAKSAVSELTRQRDELLDRQKAYEEAIMQLRALTQRQGKALDSLTASQAELIALRDQEVSMLPKALEGNFLALFGNGFQAQITDAEVFEGQMRDMLASHPELAKALRGVLSTIQGGSADTRVIDGEVEVQGGNEVMLAAEGKSPLSVDAAAALYAETAQEIPTSVSSVGDEGRETVLLMELEKTKAAIRQLEEDYVGVGRERDALTERLQKSEAGYADLQRLHTQLSLKYDSVVQHLQDAMAKAEALHEHAGQVKADNEEYAQQNSRLERRLAGTRGIAALLAVVSLVATMGGGYYAAKALQLI